MRISETKSFLRIPVIYGIKNLQNSKWYIGSCLDMKDRFERHRYYLKHNIHHSSKLQRAYNIYGDIGFDVVILHHLKEGEDRFALEQYYIEKYNSVKEGYNMLEKCIYVDNFHLSDSAKANFLLYVKTLEKSVIAIDRFTGKIDNSFESITKAAKYYKTSSSNISRVCKGSLRYIKDHVFVYTEDYDKNKNYIVQHKWKGVPKSESQKEKMRHSKNCCPIYKYDLKGNLLENYYSIQDAARKNNLHESSIRRKMAKNISINGYMFSRTKL